MAARASAKNDLKLHALEQGARAARRGYGRMRGRFRRGSGGRPLTEREGYRQECRAKHPDRSGDPPVGNGSSVPAKETTNCASRTGNNVA